MSEEETNDIPPHLFFNKYLQAGKVLCVLLIAVTVIGVLAPFFIAAPEDSDTFAYYIYLVDLSFWIALLLIFRHYLLNFELPGVRNALYILAVLSILTTIVNFIFTSAFLQTGDPQPIWGDYALIDIVDTLIITGGNVAFWACFIYIGINLYRYKDDFVGGLQPLGQVCFIVVGAGIITEAGWIIASISDFYPSLTKPTSLISDMAYIYLLYVMHFTFRSAQKYIRDSE